MKALCQVLYGLILLIQSSHANEIDVSLWTLEERNDTIVFFVSSVDIEASNICVLHDARKVIVIGQWMLDICESEDELAAIVMHEKAHLILGHGEKVWYEKVCDWFSGWFTDEEKPRFRGPPDPKSVERENETDEKGLMLMAEAGYDPQAAVDFWTRYYERTGWWEGDGTHPKPRERLAHLNALMPKARKLFLSKRSVKKEGSKK